MTKSSMNVAIVHERFTEYAGSEQVVAELAREWPDADVLAPIALPDRMPEPLRGRIRSTALSKAVRRNGGYAHLLPLLPVAMRRLPLDTAPQGRPDVVVASHHAFATQVVHATDAPVVAYVHTPARWVWDATMRSGEIGGRAGAIGLAAFAAAFRPADRAAVQRVHSVVANSTAVAQRCAQWWGREAEVVHPPVDMDYFTADPAVEREDFFLLAGRLVPYKQPELAIAAADRAGVRLVVAGEGRMLEECRRIAGPTVEFRGRVSDDEMRSLMRRARATLMPGVEDFGIVPVQAQACGSPVIATAAGGSLDTVVAGVTGVLVEPRPASAVADWAEALRDFDPRYDADSIRQHAESFRVERFRSAMADVVARVWNGSGTAGESDAA